MATYDELDTLVTALKISAINAWMKSEDWIGDARVGGWFKLESGGSVPYDERVSGTDAAGNGGGRLTVNKVDESHETTWVDGFSSIRAEIDQMIEPWRTLPHPDTFEKWITPMRDATAEIAITAVDKAGAPTGGGKIVGFIELAVTASNDWAGLTASTFKLNFLSQLGSAVGGSYALCLCLGGHLEAQKRIWKDTRQAVADTVENLTKAYDSIVYAGFDWTLAFSVLGYAAAGAALFAAGGGGAVIAAGVATLGVDIASDSYDKASSAQPSPGEQYEAIRAKAPSYFTSLNDEIVKEERSISHNLNHNLNIVLAHKSSFDLARPALLDVADDSDLSAVNVFYRDQQVRDMCSSYLPAIAGCLVRASDHAKASYAGTFNDFDRGDGIGIDTNGPLEEWVNLWSVTHQLLQDLGEKTKASGVTLDLAMSDIGKADTGAMDDLEKQARAASVVGTGNSFGIPWGGHLDTDA